MPADYYHIQLGDRTFTIPLYDLSAVDMPALRFAAPDGSGDVLAPRLVENPPLDAAHALRIGLDGTVYAIDLNESATLADFEDGDWPGSWTANTGDYTLTQHAISGAYSLTSTGGDPVVNAQATTPRGWSYTWRVATVDTDFAPWLLTNAQDASDPLVDCYAAEIYPPGDSIGVYADESGDSTEWETTTVTDGISPGNVYHITASIDAGRLRARLFDARGEHLASTNWLAHDSHTGGYPGISGSSNGERYDDIVRHPLGTAPPARPLVVESFESGDLAAWSGDTSALDVTTWPTHTGNYALRASDDLDRTIRAGDALPVVPQAGDTIRFNVRFNEGLGGRVQFDFGVQDTDHHYAVRVRPGQDDFELWKDDGGLDSLDETTVYYTTGEWYEVELDWHDEGGFDARLYDEAGGQHGDTLGSDDAEWTNGDIRFGLTRDGHCIDHLRIDP